MPKPERGDGPLPTDGSATDKPRFVISREFTRTPKGKEICPLHPGNFAYQCGMWLGYKKGEGPDTPKILGLQYSFNEKMDWEITKIMEKGDEPITEQFLGEIPGIK